RPHDAVGRAAAVHRADVRFLRALPVGAGAGPRRRLAGARVRGVRLAGNWRAGPESVDYLALAGSGAGSGGRSVLGDAQLCDLLGVAGRGGGVVLLRTPDAALYGFPAGLRRRGYFLSLLLPFRPSPGPRARNVIQERSSLFGAGGLPGPL